MVYFFKDILNQDTSLLFELALLIGCVKMLQKLLRIMNFIYVNFLRSRFNLKKRYGDRSWAIVTGASDGIGKSLVFELSNEGFNIILVGRSRIKLQAVELQLQKRNILTQIVVVDFLNSQEKNLFDLIIAQIQDKDISILVNNVGIDAFDKFENLSDEVIKDIINVNCLPITLLTKKLIPNFIKRLPQKSCIINMSSLAGEIPTAYFNVYSASKAYGDYLTQILSHEYPEIDIISVKPSEVSTQMTFNRKPDILTITAQDCAKSIIDQMGIFSITYGNWRHHIQAVVYKLVPLKLYNMVLIKFIAPVWLKERAEGQKILKRKEY